MPINKYVLFTGGFDPVHSGHISGFNEAAKVGKLIVAPNSDEWLKKKKKAVFQPFFERSYIISNLNSVHDVLAENSWDDSDGSACGAIKKFYDMYSGTDSLLFFANGGDRTPTNISEKEINLCIDLGILLLFNVGGAKTQSSSTLLNNWTARN